MSHEKAATDTIAEGISTVYSAEQRRMILVTRARLYTDTGIVNFTAAASVKTNRYKKKED